MAIRADGEPSLALTLVGSEPPAWGKPLLRWVSPKDLTSTLFTLDDALDHAQGALHDVVVPSGWVFA